VSGAALRRAIGSYEPDDVTFLLTELPDLGLELPTDVRERMMQGGGHYAETLPIEYRPTPEYEALFETLVESHAARVALLTSTLARRVAEEHHDAPVLVSLARAGTPVGVLLRRALRRLAVDASHYSVSIVRDRGIDPVALRELLARHPAEQLVFVDGWTGKGAIKRELDRALAAFEADTGERVAPTPAVLADTGHVCELFASRDDELIPSACLNSTVSGLISRTVVRPDLLGPDAYHGVRVYREFADRDRSRAYVDAVAAHFDAVEPEIEPLLAAARRAGPADGRGLRAVEAVQAARGIADVNRVKPGIGETTRVLLRRAPSRVLFDPVREADLGHVLMLARDRDVPVEPYADGVYACHGLVDDRSGAR